MGSKLPEITEDQFRGRLAAAVPRLDEDAPGGNALDAAAPGTESVGTVISDRAVAGLYRHYTELRRWNPRVSLVGPGTAGDLVGRHYGESLAALPLVRAEDRTLVDVGSGAGFPGLILAVARESLSATLIEPRQKKWLFLKSAVRKIGLSCQCLNARVAGVLPAGLPDDVDLVTCRALKMPPEIFGLFYRHSPRVRFLLWHGEGLPEIPRPLLVRRQWRLSGSYRRRILEIQAEP